MGEDNEEGSWGMVELPATEAHTDWPKRGNESLWETNSGRSRDWRRRRNMRMG